MTRDLTADLDLLRTLADQAATLGREKFRAFNRLENKDQSGFDPVTEADQEIEALLRNILTQERPGDDVLGEEGEDTAQQSEWRWIIDPIDGTRAFIAGLPTWCTLIALTRLDQPVISVISQPFTGEVFYGLTHETERKAWHEHNGEISPLKVSRTRSLDSAILTSTDGDLFRGDEAKAFGSLKSRSKLVRYGLDAYGYAAVALGGVDLVVESGLQPWDIAALVPVVEGAGGLISNWSGGKPLATGQLLASATSELHREALDVLKSAAL